MPTPAVRGLVLAALLAAPSAAFGQRAAASSAGARVAALSVALYTAGANVREATDTAMSALATQVLRRMLDQLLGAALVDSAEVSRAAWSDSARSIAGGDRSCNVVVACARYVGGRVGARWVGTRIFAERVARTVRREASSGR